MPSDEMVEKVARALCASKRVVDTLWRSYVPQAEAAIAALTATMGEEKPVDLSYKLPCDVRVAPITTIRKGCELRTLIACIKRREGKPDDVVKFPPRADAHPSREDVVEARKAVVEECAKIAEARDLGEQSEWGEGVAAACEDIAAAIRKLGERS